MSARPGIGPVVKGWSIGKKTPRPVVGESNRRSLIFFPPLDTISPQSLGIDTTEITKRLDEQPSLLVREM
jgi:hypothetical protein